MTVYVDTSAAAKLLADEPEAKAVVRLLDEAVAAGDDLTSSLLLETELRRFAMRGILDQTLVTQLLARFTLLEPDASLYRIAGLIGDGSLRSLDALHLAAAIMLEADSILTYDHRQAQAAQALGLAVLAPT